MNLIAIPYHDTKKMYREGFRTRDAHFIEQFFNEDRIEKLLIINRPYSAAEAIYQWSSWKTPGKEIYRKLNGRIVELSPNCYAADYLDFSFFGPLIKKRLWFWEAYAGKGFISFIKEALRELNILDYNVLVSNVYSNELLKELDALNTLFDAYDNLYKIPDYSYMKEKLFESYSEMAALAGIWTTNSEENKKFYMENYNAVNISVIKNGVDTGRFKTKKPAPQEYEKMKRPVIFFGGKISYLLNSDLLNYIAEKNPDKSFVIAGQALNQEVFKKIRRDINIHYIGDIQYDDYPAYVQHSDLCMIPYLSGDKTHGGDSIKFYEFLAAGKKIVATEGNGIYKGINPNVIVTSDPCEFSDAINELLKREWIGFAESAELSWKGKADSILTLLTDNKTK